MEQLVLTKKAEILLNETIYPMLKNFPQSEKFCLCQEIKQAMYSAIQKSMLFSVLKNKNLLKEADAHRRTY